MFVQRRPRTTLDSVVTTIELVYHGEVLPLCCEYVDARVDLFKLDSIGISVPSMIEWTGMPKTSLKLGG